MNNLRMTPRPNDNLLWPKDGIALCADPIYKFIEMTYPLSRNSPPDEKAEKDLIDHPWLQRLRQIHQLQSAWWIFPSAEHTRFQHALGAMHLGKEFAIALYPSLRKVVGQDCPSLPYIEETLRLGGLLHDVGHGPFGHFFDEQYLIPEYNITHEDIGQKIITKEFGTIIKRIRRSPSDNLRPDEILDPGYIAFLIKRPSSHEQPDNKLPDWLKLLRVLFSGIYTIDNLDYVMRDAYMAGVALDIINVKRLLFYSFFSSDGLTLHDSGKAVLKMFVEARRNLYDVIYYHRTTRAIDLTLKDIFKNTIKKIIRDNPLDNLATYLALTDWHVLLTGCSWSAESKKELSEIGREWKNILDRKVRWKMAFARDFPIEAEHSLYNISSVEEIEQQIRSQLPHSKRGTRFKVDIATLDTRPENPSKMGVQQVYIFNSSTGKTSSQPLETLFEDIPFKLIKLRVYSLDHKNDDILTEAAHKIMSTAHRDTNATNT